MAGMQPGRDSGVAVRENQHEWQEEQRAGQRRVQHHSHRVRDNEAPVAEETRRHDRVARACLSRNTNSAKRICGAECRQQLGANLGERLVGLVWRW
jgi:hypothetical protein